MCVYSNHSGLNGTYSQVIMVLSIAVWDSNSKDTFLGERSIEYYEAYIWADLVRFALLMLFAIFICSSQLVITVPTVAQNCRLLFIVIIILKVVHLFGSPFRPPYCVSSRSEKLQVQYSTAGFFLWMKEHRRLIQSWLNLFCLQMDKQPKLRQMNSYKQSGPDSQKTAVAACSNATTEVSSL